MLSITVKTMDSQSRQFEIPISTKIKDFKDTIASSVNVPAGNQRLIFQGRVLPDDFLLTQEHDGKVLHLVQRLPGVTTAAPSSSTPASTTASPSGAAFNPGQLSQMIFQQAMSGLGNLLVGGSVSGNMVPNPTNPNEQIMNIQIDLNGSTTGSSRTSTTSTTTNAPTRANSRAQGRRPLNASAPRQQLRAVQRNLRQLDTVLNQLESRASGPAAEETAPVQESSAREAEEGSGDVYASELVQNETRDEAMDTGNSEGADAGRAGADATSNQSTTRVETSASPASGSTPSCAAHPSLGELGTFYARMLQAQRRLEPFINQMVAIFNTDPSFSSTQSPEYRSASRLLTLTLQGQQFLAEIQRLLSQVVIPLGRTPPRSMLLRAPPGVSHSHSQAAAEARRIHHAVHAGMTRLATPRGPIRAPGGQAPTPTAGGVFRQRLIPVGQGMQMRWGMPPVPPNMAASGANNAPATPSNPSVQIPVGQGMQMRWGMPPVPPNMAASGANNAPATPSNPSVQIGARPSTTPPSSGGSTVFSVQPPTYTVQVNATIQPQIMFSVGGANAATTTITDTSPASGNTTATQGRQQTGSTTTTTTSSSNSHTTRTIGSMPTIPGIQSDVLNNLMQSVAQSVQNQLPTEQQGTPPRGAGVIVVQGPPGGENQIPEDISNIVGQSVFNAVYNQLTGSSQPNSQSRIPANVQFVVSSANASGVSGTATTVQASSTTTTTTSSQGQSSRVTVSTGSSNKDDVKNATSNMDAAPTGQTSDQGQSSQSPSLDWPGLLMQLRGAANLFRYDLSQRASELMQNFGFNLAQTTSQSRNFLSQLFNTITTRMTCNELLDAVQGNSAQLRRLRTILRNMTNEAYFPNGSPTPEQLTRVAGEISEIIRESTSEFFAGARIVPDVDLVESNLSLMRHSIQRLLEIVFFSDDAVVYDREVGQHTRYCISMWVRLNESILRGGRRELLQLLQNYRGLQQGGAAQLLMGFRQVMRFQTSQDPLDFLLTLLTTLQAVNQDQIDQFVLSQAPTIVESDSATTVDEEEEETSQPSSDANQAKKFSKSKDAPRSSAGPPSASAPPSTSAPPSAPPSTSATSAASFAASKDDWKEEVPAKWVDTIVADAEAQQNAEPQLAFSEAYLAGMPASKRRKVLS